MSHSIPPYRPLVAALLLLASPVLAQSPAGIELRVAPRDWVIAREARANGLGYSGVSPYHELILQTIYFINRSPGPITLEGGQIDLLAGGAVLQTTAMSAAEMARAQGMAASIAQAKLTTVLDVLFSAGSSLPAGVALSPSLSLEKGTAGLVDDYFLLVRTLPDQVRVTARAKDAAGKAVSGEITLPVRLYQAKNTYVFPVEAGPWWVTGYPGLHGHHTWTASTTFAYDITRVDERGSWARGGVDDWRTGSVPKWTDWYAYDKKVLAAAAGTVVKVVDTVEFPLDFWNRRAGESVPEYEERIGVRQIELLTTGDPLAAAGGNHLIIRHEGEEYSFYAHLAYGTIRVKEGQKVAQGEHIAGLGGTGEQPAVHLHFQLNDSPSMLTARSLPVEFTNAKVNEAMVPEAPPMRFQSGYFVQVGP